MDQNARCIRPNPHVIQLQWMILNWGEVPISAPMGGVHINGKPPAMWPLAEAIQNHSARGGVQPCNPLGWRLSQPHNLERVARTKPTRNVLGSRITKTWVASKEKGWNNNTENCFCTSVTPNGQGRTLHLSSTVLWHHSGVGPDLPTTLAQQAKKENVFGTKKVV